jgi:hypothetical protein
MLGAYQGTRADVLTFDVVTTFAQKHWESHARRCVETFGLYWQGIHLTTFDDEALESGSDWLAAFKERHKDRPTDNYRKDAVRFAHKVAAIELAFQGGISDYLIWMDADCVTHAPVDVAWLTRLSQGADFAYLARDRKYSECGFLMIRRNQRGEKLIKRLVDLYRTDKLFLLPEWHDCWAFDHARNGLQGQLQCASLSGNANRMAHPFVNGPLGERLDHCKGARKAQGRSHASDLKVQRTEAHWNV